MGIFACYDACGQQLLEICRYYDFMVPEDIAIIGVDNDELLCEMATPSMSSIIPNSFRTGAYAAEIMDRMMRGEKLAGRKHSIEPLGVRKRVSTDVLTVGDHHVAEAVAFIRQNAHKNIRVEDVLQRRSPFPARSRGPLPKGARSHAAPGNPARAGPTPCGNSSSKRRCLSRR